MSNTHSPMPTYDPAPLLAFASRLLGDPDASGEELGALLGVSSRTITRWTHGVHLVSETNADTIAVRIGVHPCNIWPEWWGNCPADDPEPDYVTDLGVEVWTDITGEEPVACDLADQPTDYRNILGEDVYPCVGVAERRYGNYAVCNYHFDRGLAWAEDEAYVNHCDSIAAEQLEAEYR